MPDELITVHGLEQTLANLTLMPAAFQRGAQGKALAAAAAPVAQALEAATPARTGDLRTHVVTDVLVGDHGGVAHVGFGKEGWKARLVELGHRMIGHKPAKKDLGIVAAHPFMGPVAAATAEQALEAYAASLEESMNDGSVKVA